MSRGAGTGLQSPGGPDLVWLGQTPTDVAPQSRVPLTPFFLIAFGLYAVTSRVPRLRRDVGRVACTLFGTATSNSTFNFDLVGTTTSPSTSLSRGAGAQRLIGHLSRFPQMTSCAVFTSGRVHVQTLGQILHICPKSRHRFDAQVRNITTVRTNDLDRRADLSWPSRLCDLCYLAVAHVDSLLLAQRL